MVPEYQIYVNNETNAQILFEMHKKVNFYGSLFVNKVEACVGHCHGIVYFSGKSK